MRQLLRGLPAYWRTQLRHRSQHFNRLHEVRRQGAVKLHPQPGDRMGEGEAAGVEGVAADRKAGLDRAGVGFFLVGVVWVRNELRALGVELAVGLVELVADQRVADVGQVDADLVIATGQRRGLGERVLREALDDFVIGL